MARAEGVPLPTPADTRAPSRGAALLKRVLTALLFLPAFLAVVMLGPLWLFALMVVVIGAAAQWEFTGMFERAGVRSFRVIGLLAGVAVTSSFALHAPEVGFTAALLAVLVAGLGGARAAWEPVAITVLGVCYVNWLIGFGILLRELPSGVEMVLLLIWVTWLGETAAYLVGSTLGRRPLAPTISPKKTIEGAVAQFAVSVAAAVVAQMWFASALSREQAVLAGALLGVVGQLGDLAESVLKRSVGTKDTGRLMPGHGGMLDRIDSLLFNTPLLFYYASHGGKLTS